jgi:hypothetical protein
MALTGAERMARLRERSWPAKGRCATGVREIAAAGQTQWAHCWAAWMPIRPGETTYPPVSRTAHCRSARRGA